MRWSIAGIPLVVLFMSGCSDKAVNPCELVTLDEVRSLASNAKEFEWHQAATSKNKDNELCVWHDGGGQNVFMLFYFISGTSDPYDIVESGMSGAEASIINVEGVGDFAAAGFVKDKKDPNGALKLFAASFKGKTIGIRAWGIDDEDSDKFQTLKQIASKALTRI